MPKIGFKRLSRGVKLLTEHIHSQLNTALDRVTNTRVDHTNLESGDALTRMSFSWPCAHDRVVGAQPRLTAAFVLPAPQELFRTDGIKLPTDPGYILDSVSFSLDTRDEPAAISDAKVGPPVVLEGSLDFDGASDVKFSLQLHGRKMTHFGNAETSFDETLLTIDYPNLGFNNNQVRTSPHVRENLGIQLAPYSSYMLVVDCFDYLSGSSFLGNSILVTLTFRSQLMVRDSDKKKVQNIPQSPELFALQQYGLPYTNPQTILTPGATAPIVAEPSPTDDGVQGALEKVDSSVRRGLEGGYNEQSRRHAFETMLTDAGYEIIAVPMWGNGWYAGNHLNNNVALLPYVGPAPYSDPVVDRRIIPLHFPMVVHHVVAHLNFSGGLPPSTATYKYEIGVGMGTGIRSDSYSYRQVAHASWDSTTYLTYLIDDFHASETAGVPTGTIRGHLYDIPLIGVGGTGYRAGQGMPVFVGKTDNPDVVRSHAASAPGGPHVPIPSIDGKEQFLEVRMLFQDTAGIQNLPATETMVGYGGHWVYIIGKKHVC